MALQLRWPLARRPPSARSAERELIRLARLPPTRDRLRQLDKLTTVLLEAGASAGPPKAGSVGDGRWAVVHTKGPLLWRTLSGRGEASQEFDPASSTVVSRAVLAGGALAARASGTYTPDPSSGPCTLAVTVTRVELLPGPILAGGRDEDELPRLSLPLGGTGRVDVAYAGDRVRVLKGSGGWAVQARE